MITELKPTTLIAAEVAPDASNYRFGSKVLNEILFPNDLYYDTYLNIYHTGNVIMPEGKYKIVGEVTKDNIGFDVEPYVDKYNNGAYRDYKDNYPFYPDFNTPNICLTNEESFYSLLAANGLYFENPLDWEKKAYLFKGSENSWGQNDLDRWQSFEDKLIKGKLLILERISGELPNLKKSTENLSKIADKDKWLKEVRGEYTAKELLLQAKYQLAAIDNQFPTKGTKAVIQEIENFLK
jgi:hypothetical protein